MDFKDYYATLGLTASASAADIKRAYRKLARKYHPDVSQEANAEARFKEVAEAHEALCDVERRAAYDAVAARHRARAAGQGEAGEGGDFAQGGFRPPPGWSSGFEFSGSGAGDDTDPSDFFASLFGRPARGGRGRPTRPQPGGDHHAKIRLTLLEAWRGGPRTITLRIPQTDADGHTQLLERRLEVTIPRGVRDGQHLRLAGQGGSGQAQAPAGDLYLVLEVAPDAQFRVDGRDVYGDLPLAPWEAALGASVLLALPDGQVMLNVPAGSRAGRQLRLKGQGLPGAAPGDFFAVLSIALPAAATAAQRSAYEALASAFSGFNPRLPDAGAAPAPSPASAPGAPA